MLLAKVPKEEETEDEGKDKEDKSDDEALSDAIRDAKVARLKILREDAKKADAFMALSRELLQSHPEYVPLTCLL